MPPILLSLAMMAGLPPGPGAGPPPEDPAAATQPGGRCPAGAEGRAWDEGRLRRRWQSLSPEEREQYRRVWEDFRRLAPERQERLRRQVSLYRRWLAELPPGRRDYVMQLSPAERLAYMKLIVKPRPPEHAEFLRQLREFFDGLDEPTRQRLWGLPPDRQEYELRWLYFRQQERLRARVFHEVLTEPERRQLLALAQSPSGGPAAEARLAEIIRRSAPSSASTQPGP